MVILVDFAYIKVNCFGVLYTKSVAIVNDGNIYLNYKMYTLLPHYLQHHLLAAKSKFSKTFMCILASLVDHPL